MTRSPAVSVLLGTVCLFFLAGAWAFGVFDAGRNATQALYLEAALREPGFLSKVRYDTYLSLGANPNHRFSQFGGVTALDVSVDQKNMFAIGKIAPLVRDDVYKVALSRACAAGDRAVIDQMVASRNGLVLQDSEDPCMHVQSAHRSN